MRAFGGFETEFNIFQVLQLRREVLTSVVGTKYHLQSDEGSRVPDPGSGGPFNMRVSGNPKPSAEDAAQRRPREPTVRLWDFLAWGVAATRAAPASGSPRRALGSAAGRPRGRRGGRGNVRRARIFASRALLSPAGDRFIVLSERFARFWKRGKRTGATPNSFESPLPRRKIIIFQRW